MQPEAPGRDLRAPALAVVAASIALLLSAALQPHLTTYTLLPAVGAVVLVAWYGGFAPALLTTALVLIGTDYLIIAPAFSLRVPQGSDLIRLVALLTVSLAVSYASQSLRSARERAEMRAEAIEALLAEMREQASTLENQAVELEQQVESTSMALHRVEQSEAELRRAHDQLSVTTYAIAHDLRSPLRAVDGYSALLARSLGDRMNGSEREHLQRIRTNVQRMAMQMDGLLSLARLSRSEMQSETVDLSVMARETFRQLGEAEPGRLVEWTVEPGMVAVGDPRLLSLLLQNVIGNAWKFSRGRRPARISVTSERSDQQIVLVVRDNGVGFDMAHADQLFRPFHRLHSDTEFEGTGIGLATAKRIVERHGGDISPESRVGEGTVMRITLKPAGALGRSSAEVGRQADVGVSGEMHSSY